MEWISSGSIRDEQMPDIDILSAIIRVSPDIDIAGFFEEYEAIESCVLNFDALNPVELYYSFDEKQTWHIVENAQSITGVRITELNDSKEISLRYTTSRDISNIFSIDDLPIIRTYITLFDFEGEKWEKYFIWK